MTTTATSLQIYGNPKLPRFTAWVDEVEKDLGDNNWDTYINMATTNTEAKVFQLISESKRAWIEKSPQVRGDPSLDCISKAIYDEKFDLGADALDLEKRFEALLDHLSPHIADLWDLFSNESASYRGCPQDQSALEGWMEIIPDRGEIHSYIPEIISDFCDHTLMWSYAHGIPLFRENT